MTRRRSDDVGPGDSVVVIVVSYRSAEVIGSFLRSVPESLQVVVVDNGSDDDTVEVVTSERPSARVIVNKANLGFAAGINVALDDLVARGTEFDAVAICNPDVVLEPDSLWVLSASLAPPEVGVVGPRTLDGSGELSHTVRRDPSLRRALGMAVLGGERADRWTGWSEIVSAPGRYDVEADVDWLVGSCLVVSRACLDAVGRWDESFFLYSEEVDFCQRTRRQGLSVRYVPSAVVSHQGGARRDAPELWALLQRNRVALYQGGHGRVRGMIFRLLVLADECLRVLTGRGSIHRHAVRVLVRPISAGRRGPTPSADASR